MKPNELVAARMSGGITIVRVVGVDASRVRVALRRKKEARLPAERVVLSTQVFAEGDEQVADFRRQSEDIASEVDIAELWEVVSDEQSAFPFDDLTELYWGADATPAQQVALLLCLDRDSLYFEAGKAGEDGKSGYAPRSPSAVEETLARRKRQAQQAAEADDLVACLEKGELPPALTPHQQMLIDSMRDYAAFGDDYTRSALVKGLLNKMERKAGNLQRLSFDLLVACGQFAPDEPLELVRDDITEAFSEDELAAAEAINQSELLDDGNRLDLTALPTITIDDADTQDRDDALSLERLDPSDVPSPSEGRSEWGQGQEYRLGIHITDAGALIPQDSVLDKAADLRMASLYIPDRKIPMLPAAVSHDKGSLEVGERRAALSLLADINADGEILRFEVKPSVIVSDAALSYDEANAAISDASHARHDMLASLHSLAEALKRQREAAGAVGIDRAELLIKVVSSDDVEVKVVQRKLAGARDGRRVHGAVQLAAGVVLRGAGYSRLVPLPDGARPQRPRFGLAPGRGHQRRSSAPVPHDAPLRPRRHAHRTSPARRTRRACVHTGDLPAPPLPRHGDAAPDNPLPRHRRAIVQRREHHQRRGQGGCAAPRHGQAGRRAPPILAAEVLQAKYGAVH